MSGFHYELTWKDNRYEVQSWLERIAWRHLRDTKYGSSEKNREIPEWIHDKPLLKTAYLVDLLAFVHAEKLALDVSGAIIPMAPDITAKQFLATQVLDEARHFEIFSHRLSLLGISKDDEAMIFDSFESEKYKKFSDLVYEQVDKGDFLGAVTALNFILEGLAHPLYDFETRYWSIADPGFSQIINGAFVDEVQHGNFGEIVIGSAVRSSLEFKNKCRTLMKDFKHLVNDVFQESRDKYATMYQSAALESRELFENIEIFQGKSFFSLTANEQIQIVGDRVEKEFEKNILRVGL